MIQLSTLESFDFFVAPLVFVQLSNLFSLVFFAGYQRFCAIEHYIIFFSFEKLAYSFPRAF